MRKRYPDVDGKHVGEPSMNGHAAPPPAESSIAVRDWQDLLGDEPVAWLVEGMIPVDGLVVLAGDPGAGKTLVTLDVALRAAHGQDWLGRSVRPHSTLYLAGEGHGGLGARLRAWVAAHPAAAQVAGEYVAIAAGVPALTGRDAVAELEQIVASVAGSRGKAPDVVVVDTLAMAAPGVDENDSGLVGAVLRVLSELRRRRPCAIVVLHHTRKPSNERGATRSQHDLRGSSAIAGAADVVLLAGNDGQAHTVRAVKVRDGEILPPVRYEIRGVETARAGERGPVVAVAPEPDPAAAEDDDERDTQALCDAVAKLVGVPTTRDSVAKAAGLRAARGRWLIDIALADKRILAGPAPGRRTFFSLPGRPESGGAQSPYTPGTAGRREPRRRSPSGTERDGGTAGDGAPETEER